MQTQAITLCRVSTLGQLRDGNLDPQIERVNKAAELLDVNIVKRWEVAASSRKGKNMKRKDLQEMLAFCRKNRRVKYLIVDEPDRFMRSVKEYYWWKVEFERVGVEIRFANNPLANSEDDRVVFDELIDVYRAEQSNNERITKTPEKQMAKMRAGYYPFPPLPGYRKTDVLSLHEPDPERFHLLRAAFKSVASGIATPNEALKKMTESGYRTINGNAMDMEHFKRFAVRPYYAGIIQVADWPVATEQGLHTPMLTKEEHEALKQIMSGKKRKFAINKKNPDYPMNEMLCFDCRAELMGQYKLTGYRNHNGKTTASDERRYYHRYRCRGCNTYFTRDELHDKVSTKLDNIILEDKELLIAELRTAWRSQMATNTNKIVALENRIHTIEQEQVKLAVSLATTDSEVAKDALTAAIEQKEQDKQAAATEMAIYTDIDAEMEAFIGYSINYTEELKAKYWSLDWDRRKRCEQLLFPDGFYVTREKNVYTPRVSPIYREDSKQKDLTKHQVSLLGGPGGA